MSSTWLGTVSQFLGCAVSDLDPTKVYFATCIVIAVIVFSFAHILRGLGRK